MQLHAHRAYTANTQKVPARADPISIFSICALSLSLLGGDLFSRAAGEGRKVENCLRERDVI